MEEEIYTKKTNQRRRSKKLVDKYDSFSPQKIVDEYLKKKDDGCWRELKTLVHNCRKTRSLLRKTQTQFDERDEDGKTPLHKCYWVEEAKKALSQGVPIDARDKDGQTPLHCCQKFEVVRFLVDNGASIKVRDKWDQTPLFGLLKKHRPAWLIRRGDCEFVMRLLELIKELNAKPYPPEEYDLLCKWLDDTDEELVAELLNLGLNPNAKSDYGEGTALHHVARSITRHKQRWPWRRFADKMQLLIEFGTDVDGRDSNGSTFLHVLISHYSNVVVRRDRWGNEHELLTDIGNLVENCGDIIDVNAKDCSNRTPLHIAALQDRNELIALLVASGADPNAKDLAGATPIYYAVRAGGRNLDALLSTELDVKAVYEEERNLLHLAAYYFKWDESPEASALSFKKLATYLRERDFDFDSQDSNCHTPLSIVMSRALRHDACIDVVRMLVDYGASLEKVLWLDRNIIVKWQCLPALQNLLQK